MGSDAPSEPASIFSRASAGRSAMATPWPVAVSASVWKIDSEISVVKGVAGNLGEVRNAIIDVIEIKKRIDQLFATALPRQRAEPLKKDLVLHLTFANAPGILHPFVVPARDLAKLNFHPSKRARLAGCS